MNPDLHTLPISGGVHYLLFGRYRGRHWETWPGENEVGFHPGIYFDQVEVPFPSNPNEHFIESGRPEGDWLYPLLDLDAIFSNESSAAMLHIHAYYIELLPEIFHSIRLNKIRTDIVITVVNPHEVKPVHNLAEDFDLTLKHVLVTPNRGRNFGPLAFLLEQGYFDEYQYVGHVHTKKTGGRDTAQTARWRQFLVANLLGCDAYPNLTGQILANLDGNPKLGIIYPDDPKQFGWDDNLSFAIELFDAKRFGQVPRHFKFPVGGMFWARTDYLRKMQSAGLKFDELMLEPVPLDGSSLHALERLMGVMPEHFGYSQAVVRLPGTTRYRNNDKKKMLRSNRKLLTQSPNLEIE